MLVPGLAATLGDDNSVARLVGLPCRIDSPAVTATGVYTPLDYAERLKQYLFERSEEGRAVRVGEKETSEQAEIVARYTDLFTRDQLEALWDTERHASGEKREELYRLRKVCEGGIVSAELVEREDALENRELAARVTFRGEELPLRSAQAKLALLHEYRDREELGDLHAEANASFNDERLDLLRRRRGNCPRSSRASPTRSRGTRRKRASRCERSPPRWPRRAARPRPRTCACARPGSTACSGRTATSSRARTTWRTYAGSRRSRRRTRRSARPTSASETLKSLGFDLAADPNIRPDLDDRPQKSPRACVIASDPPKVVHLITRAQGGLHDYQAFLHEAGHALHYAGCDPTLPYTFRRLSRDHALTEIYSYIVEAISREPGWHALHFGLSDEEAAQNAEATTFLEALLFRRYAAKLDFELAFWDRFCDDGGTSEGYAEQLTAATGVRYRSDGFLSDMDAGFYSADYLRAWIRSAQLRARLVEEIGEDWWRSPETGERLRALFCEGTKPSSEGGRRAARLRPARHRAAPARARRVVGVTAQAQNLRGMKEQSQIDDMRAAIRGAIERGQSHRLPSPAHQPEPEADADQDDQPSPEIPRPRLFASLLRRA